MRSRAIETSGSLSLMQEIIRPDGATFSCGPTYLDELDCQLPVSGTYTLLVKDGTGTHTGTYNVILLRLNNPVGCLSLGFGNPPTSASIDAAAEVDCYTFTGTAGDRMRSRAIETSGSLSLMQEIIRPDGATFSCGPTYLDELDCQLPVSGTYTLLVKDGTGTHTGTYNVILLRLNKPVGCLSLGFGDPPTSGSVVAAAEVDCYTFTGTAGDWVRSRAIETSGSLSLMQEIIRPDGRHSVVGRPTWMSWTASCRSVAPTPCW